jgi:hypothetical protein
MLIPWYRSWPAENEWHENDLERRNYVHDDLFRLYCKGSNYTNTTWIPLIEKDHDYGFCMLEWDMALDKRSQLVFAGIAIIEPREILVAPYAFHNTWSCWIGNDGSGPSADSRPIKRNELYTDSFGLGCIYIPYQILVEFLDSGEATTPNGFTDSTFGKWYRQKYGQARVTWEIHPQHLHDYERY